MRDRLEGKQVRGPRLPRRGVHRAYLNNTGRLKDYLRRGRTAYCLRSLPGRRTRYRLVAVRDLWAAAILDARLQMRAFEEAVARGLLPWLGGCRVAGRDVRLGSSRIDYVLECPGGRVYVEVKSAVLRGSGGYAMYPDCPSVRGRRHIAGLTSLARRGERCVVAFMATLPGARAFKPHGGGDPEIPRLLRTAVSAGVEVRALAMYYDPPQAR